MLIWARLCIWIIEKKDILILGKFLMQGLDDATLTVKAEYSINFSEQKNFCFSLHNYEVNRYFLTLSKFTHSKKKFLK